MEIAGLQKTTCIDYPGKVACIVFTKGCNFRCPYCHNSSLVLEDGQANLESVEGILAFLEKRKGILDGVCITGGEALLQKNLSDFIRQVKSKGYLVKIDTNGTSPKKLKQLMDDRLIDYIAMDVKHTQAEYHVATGIDDTDINKIKESIKIISSGTIDYEFRTTAVKGIHKQQDFLAIGQWIRGAKRYFIQNYQGSDETIANKTQSNQDLKSFTPRELESILHMVREYVPSTQLRVS